MMSRFTRSALFAAASSIALGSAASAQVFDQVGGGERRTVEVITVTAQQREESAQDVPISIGAYDNAALDAAGVQDIKDLISIAPGLMVTSTQSETITTARIRGIGTVGDNFGLESSVGVYIDGVFRSRNGVGFGDLGELERIEVLRGPQGTLFGKNTSAGVLNIVTQAPEFEHGGSFEAQLGDYGYQRYSLGLTGPIVEDVLAFRIFGADAERDGFTSLVIDQDPNYDVRDSETENYSTVRGQLLWTPSETVTGRLIADYSERDERCCSAVAWDYSAVGAALVGGVTEQTAVGAGVGFPANPEDRTAYSNREYAQLVEDWGVSAEFDIELPVGTLTTVTAFRNWQNRRSQDIDYSAADLAYRDAANNFTDLTRFSQEIRLQGATERLDWLVGGFFSHEELRLGDAIQYGNDWEPFLGLIASGLTDPNFVSTNLNGLALGFVPGVPGLPGYTPLAPGSFFPAGSGVAQDVYDQTSESWAIFTHNTYQFTDNLAVTAGIRYTNETKDVFATFNTANTPGCSILEAYANFNPATAWNPAAAFAGTAFGPLAPTLCLPYARSGLDANGYDRERSDEELSGTLRLTYDVNDDVMVYGGYSRGFKAGGFNLDRQLNGPVDATGYTNSNSEFAPEIIDSWELGFKSQLFGNVMQVNGNVFLQQVEDFQLNTFNGLAFVVESVDESESMGLELDAFWATPVPGLDLSAGYAYVNTEYTTVNTGDPLVDAIQGKDYSLSPEHFVTGQALYERPVFGNMLFTAAADARYVSEYNTGSDLDPEKLQEAFTLVNARIGIGREDGLWSIEAWGRNLTDETYAQVAFDAFAQGSRGGAGTSNDPRGTASYMAFLGAPRTWGVTLRTEW
ncbi:TonB-dependent receptor [Maricaulaceae bacterium EIL42A08]|nr:TonB-dependent receptor [Maricaulaceae bacterium EIL42A08]